MTITLAIATRTFNAAELIAAHDAFQAAADDWEAAANLFPWDGSDLSVVAYWVGVAYNV